MLKTHQKNITNEFTFSGLANFAAKLIYKIESMEVITIESQAFKDLQSKIGTIAKFVTAMQNKEEEKKPEDGWVDTYDVCTFLKVSAKTLQRLRASGKITFSRISGKIFYRISEIERLMNDNMILSTDEHLQNLIKNNQLHVEQRRNIKANK